MLITFFSVVFLVTQPLSGALTKVGSNTKLSPKTIEIINDDVGFQAETQRNCILKSLNKDLMARLSEAMLDVVTLDSQKTSADLEKLVQNNWFLTKQAERKTKQHWYFKNGPAQLVYPWTALRATSRFFKKSS